MSVIEYTYVCPKCPPPRRTQYSGGGDQGDICETHGWVEAVAMVPAAQLEGAVEALREIRFALDHNTPASAAVDAASAIVDAALPTGDQREVEVVPAEQLREAVAALADVRSLVAIWERSPLEKVRALAADMRAVLDAERGAVAR